MPLDNNVEKIPLDVIVVARVFHNAQYVFDLYTSVAREYVTSFWDKTGLVTSLDLGRVYLLNGEYYIRVVKVERL